MEDLLLQRNYQRVVYLGDGRGDFCPCTKLGPSDHVLARQHYPDGTACALPQLLAEQGGPSQAQHAQHTTQPQAGVFSSAQSATEAENEGSSSMQAATAPSTMNASSQLGSTGAACVCEGGGVQGETGKQNAEALDQARYQGAIDAAVAVQPDEELPPPPPRPSGLHSATKRQPRQHGHPCVATLQSWASASAAAAMLHVLI